MFFDQIRPGDQRGEHSLEQGRVYVWLLSDRSVSQEAVSPMLSQVLAPREMARADRFLSQEQAHQYRLAHALKRLVLTDLYPEIAPRDWRFDTNAHGKPQVAVDLAARAPVAFNLSHAKGLVALAVSHRLTLVQTDVLGVDVEATGRRTNLEIARRFFAPSEVAALAALPEDVQRTRFFTLWTLKESYIKARGLGLAIPLGSFAFSFGAEGAISFQPDPEADIAPSAWRFAQSLLPSGHAMAVGLAAAQKTIRCHVVEVTLDAPPRRVPIAWDLQSAGMAPSQGGT